MHFGISVGTTDSHLSPMPAQRKMAPLVEETVHHKFQRTAGFCLNSQDLGKWTFLWT